MLIWLFELVVVSVVAYGLFKWATFAWKKADVVHKVEELSSVEEQYDVVKESEERYGNVNEKRKAISKFKSK